jgi:hypothetical protein
MRAGQVGWILGAGLMLGAPARAAADSPPAASELGSAEALRSTCLATRPVSRVLFADDDSGARAAFEERRRAVLERLHHVALPVGGFRLTEGRASGEIALDTSRPLSAMRGALSLSLSGEARLVLASDTAQGQALQAAVQKGSAALDVWFELDDRSGAPCSGSVASDLYVVSAIPAAVTLRDGLGSFLARAETPLAERHRALVGGYSGAPSVSIGPITASGGVDTRAVAARLKAIGDPVRHCYARRLAEAPNAGGTMVVGVEISESGRVEGVTFTVDTVQDEMLRRCVDGELRKLGFTGVAGLPAPFQVPVELKLVPSGGK